VICWFKACEKCAMICAEGVARRRPTSGDLKSLGVNEKTHGNAVGFLVFQIVFK